MTIIALLIAGLTIIGAACVFAGTDADTMLGGIFALVLAAGLAAGLALAEVHVPQHTRSAPVPR